MDSDEQAVVGMVPGLDEGDEPRAVGTHGRITGVLDITHDHRVLETGGPGAIGPILGAAVRIAQDGRGPSESDLVRSQC